MYSNKFDEKLLNNVNGSIFIQNVRKVNYIRF